MTQEEIKGTLLHYFKKEFNIDAKVDIYDSKSQTFIHSVSFEFVDKKGGYHDAQMDVHGIIHKNTEPSETHNPIGDGRAGEEQGGGVFIDYWELLIIECWVDSGLPKFAITIDELLTFIK